MHYKKTNAFQCKFPSTWLFKFAIPVVEKDKKQPAYHTRLLFYNLIRITNLIDL